MNTLWRDGPNWLLGLGDGQVDDQEIPDECLSEMKTKDLNQVHGLLTLDPALGLSHIFSCEDFSSIDRLLTVTALVLKFCQILRTKTCPDVAAGVYDDDANAERLWILECQRRLVMDKKFKHCFNSLRMRIDYGGVEGESRMQQFLTQQNIPYFSTRVIISLSCS